MSARVLIVDADDTLVMLDFGCVKACDPAFADGILSVMDACWQRDAQRVARLYRELGFGKAGEREDAFDPELLRQYHDMLLAPFLLDREFDFGAWGLRDQMQRFMLRHPPANNQRAVALFLSLGHHDALVRKLSTAFAERRKRLVHAVSAFLPEWRATDSAGGTSIWLEGPPGTDSVKLADVAAARSVLVEPGGRFFDAFEGPSRHMRLGISSIALQHIEPGIRELATAAGRRPAAA